MHIFIPCQTPFLFWLNDTALYVYAPFCLSIHLRMDMCFCLWPVIVNNVAMNVGLHILDFLFSVLLGVYIPTSGIAG